MSYSISIIIFALFLVFEYISLRLFKCLEEISSQRQALAIGIAHNKRIEKILLETRGAEIWNENDKESLTKRIETDDFYKEKIENFLKTQEVGYHKQQFRGKFNGKDNHWYEIRMLVDHTETGHVKCKGLILNIDKEKELEAKVIDTHRTLLNVQTREGFISAMNHQIRTPLHVVVGFSTMLATPGAEFSDQELEEFSNFIKTNSAGLKKVINDILLTTLMQNTNISAICKPQSLKDLLDMNLWQDALFITEYRHNTVEIQEGGDDVMVNVDEKMIATVMDNLVINASEFSTEGSRIQIGWNKVNDGVEIWVKDEGIGIDQEYQELIYDRFFKTDSFRSGCGLGLFISKTYMDLMHGTISVDSAPGKGSTFTIKVKF